MIKKINLWSLFILPIAIGGALFLSPAIGSQESQRGECEQACNETFKACNTAPNADRAACSAAYKECRDKCKTVDPHPSPTPTVSPAPSPSPVPSPDGPESARGQCEQDCNAAFKACNTAPEANRAACSTAYKECRDKCKTVDPHPSPTPTVSPTPTPSPVPSPDGPESARGQCEQDCNAAFKACNTAPDANRAACSTAYKECRDKCKEVDPHPSPSPTPGE